MPQGKVKWFDAKKGFGFIVSDEGKDVFVHYSSITSDDSYKTLDDNVEVEFEMIDDGKGLKATNVKIKK